MHIDMPAVILGMAAMAAFAGIFLTGSAMLTARGPWVPKLCLCGSVWCAILSGLSALYLISGFIFPETSDIYDQLVSQRGLHAAGLAVGLVMAAVLWRTGVRWRPPAGDGATITHD